MTKQKKAFIEWLSAKYSINFKEELRIWKTETVDTDYVNELFDIALMEFGLTKAKLASSCRKHDIVMVRHYIIYLIHQKEVMTLIEISKHFGSRDHTTILYAKNKIADRLQIKDKQTLGIAERFDKYLNTITDAEKEETL